MTRSKQNIFVLFEEGQARCDSLCVRFVASAIVVWIRKIGKVLKVVFFFWEGSWCVKRFSIGRSEVRKDRDEFPHVKSDKMKRESCGRSSAERGVEVESSKRTVKRRVHMTDRRTHKERCIRKKASRPCAEYATQIHGVVDTKQVCSNRESAATSLSRKKNERNEKKRVHSQFRFAPFG
jgi:hypothetical protein